jgi:hypothetical protein
MPQIECFAPKGSIMPRYYFHIRNEDDLVPDVEGIEMPRARAAREEAEYAAREILADRVRRERL